MVVSLNYIIFDTSTHSPTFFFRQRISPTLKPFQFSILNSNFFNFFYITSCINRYLFFFYFIIKEYISPLWWIWYIYNFFLKHCKYYKFINSWWIFIFHKKKHFSLFFKIKIKRKAGQTYRPYLLIYSLGVLAHVGPHTTPSLFCPLLSFLF
jgi:hypothetical protein